MRVGCRRRRRRSDTRAGRRRRRRTGGRSCGGATNGRDGGVRRSRGVAGLSAPDQWRAVGATGEIGRARPAAAPADRPDTAAVVRARNSRVPTVPSPGRSPPSGTPRHNTNCNILIFFVYFAVFSRHRSTRNRCPPSVCLGYYNYIVIILFRFARVCRRSVLRFGNRPRC